MAPTGTSGAAEGPAVVKLVVAGGFGVGKTTFVRAVSEIEPLTTEEYLTQVGASTDSLDGVDAKDTTTVAFDFGRLTLDVPLPLELFLFGTPGQDRFVDLWYDLSRGAVGAVVLSDTRRLAAGFAAVSFFERLGLPFLVAVNEFDGAHRYPEHEIRQAIGVSDGTPVASCDARVPASVAGILLTLVDHALSSTSPDTTTRYLSQRPRYGGTLAGLPVLRDRLGAMESRLRAARHLAYQAVHLLDHGQPCDGDLINAKYLGHKWSARSGQDAMELHGARALQTDYPLQRLWRDIQHTHPPAGTGEFQRIRLAEGGLGEESVQWSRRLAAHSAVPGPARGSGAAVPVTGPLDIK